HTPHPLSFTVPSAPEIYPLSLHDALPIYRGTSTIRLYISRRSAYHGTSWRSLSNSASAPVSQPYLRSTQAPSDSGTRSTVSPSSDRKSTRLNSSHVKISYAVFCLKKKIIK